MAKKNQDDPGAILKAILKSGAVSVPPRQRVCGACQLPPENHPSQMNLCEMLAFAETEAVEFRRLLVGVLAGTVTVEAIASTLARFPER